MQYWVYKVPHLWSWLTCGNNAQAVSTLVSLIFGIPTICFLVRATQASRVQAIAANVQAEAARVSIRPVLIAEADVSAGMLSAVYVQNKGAGVATQVTWAVCEVSGKVGLNVFLRPTELKYQVVRKGGFSGGIQNNQVENQDMELISGDNKLILVNYMDLLGTIHQTQLLLFEHQSEIRSVLGFGTRSVEERAKMEAKLGSHPGPEDIGLTAW